MEESERRYSEALDDLHARLDQLSQTTDAARAAGSPEDAETFGRLHDQVSSLARRLEGEASTPLDDFERLGRALAGDLNYAAGLPGTPSASDPLDNPRSRAGQPFAPSVPDLDYSAPFAPLLPGDDDLDRRLVEMAHRLRELDRRGHAAASARSLERAARRASAARSPRRSNRPQKASRFEPLERQISDMAQQLGHAEAQLAKIGEIESALHKLIERVDASPSPIEEVATKAASEAARLVADEVKLSAAAPSVSTPCIATSWR